MNLLKLALKNIRFRWMTQILTLFLLTLTTPLFWVIQEAKVQSENKLVKNLAKLHLDIGANGSAMQI